MTNYRRLADTGYRDEAVSLRDMVGSSLLIRRISSMSSRQYGDGVRVACDVVDGDTGELITPECTVTTFGVQALRVAEHLGLVDGVASVAVDPPVLVDVRKKGDVVVLE